MFAMLLRVLALALVGGASVSSALSTVLLRGGGDARRSLDLASVGRIAHLRLINADTDQPIAGYDPLPSNLVLIDWNALPTRNLNIEALTEGGAVASVQWNWNGAVRNENSAKWALCGNKGADFLACSGSLFRLGANATLKVTAYSGLNATGPSSPATTIQLVIQGTIDPPTLTLVDAANDRDIGPLVDGTIIDLSTTPSLNVRANTDAIIAETGSVHFAFDSGDFVRIENGAPFALAGNTGSDYFSWTPKVGEHTIAATTFRERNAQGASVSSVFVTFVVVPAVDMDPPRLLNFTLLTPSTVNVSLGDQYSQIQIVAQDNGWGVGEYANSIRAICYPPRADEGTTFILMQNVFGPSLVVGQPAIHDAYLKFPPYMYESTCHLELTLEDYNGNRVQLSAQNLTEQNFTSQLTVVGAQYSRPSFPLLQSFSATTPTTARFYKAINYTAVINSRTLLYANLRAAPDGWNGVDLSEERVTQSVASFNDEQTQWTIRFSFDTEPTYYKVGTYWLTLELVMDDRTVIHYNHTTLAALGFPNSLTLTPALPTAPSTTTPTRAPVATPSPVAPPPVFVGPTAAPVPPPRRRTILNEQAREPSDGREDAFV